MPEISTLTEKDIDYLEERFQKTFVTKDDLRQTKSDLLNVLDKILKEVVANRQERTLLANRSIKHSERLEKLEAIHPRYQHSAI